MAYKHQSARRHESITFGEVVFFLNKMTEGRRLELRSKLSAPNKRIREILKEQAGIEKINEADRDTARWLDLQDEFDGVMLQEVNPVWITWGVKQIEGLEVEGRPLTVSDWQEWPSALFDEILEAVKAEATLNGAEKNLKLRTTSGAPEPPSQSLSTAPSANGGDSGEIETVSSSLKLT